jgi:hypothetical protein
VGGAAGLLTRGSLSRRLPSPACRASGFSAREHLPSQRRDRPGLAPGSLTELLLCERAYHRPVPPSVPPLAIDLDAVLGDTRQLWRAWIEHAGSTLDLDGGELPLDRGSAAVELDAVAGNWRVLLQRFAEERAPVYLRPDADVSAALRRLAARGTRLGVFTDAPAELAGVALVQLGATRRVDVVETGAGALERLLAQLGKHAKLVRSRDELVRAAA